MLKTSTFLFLILFINLANCTNLLSQNYDDSILNEIIYESNYDKKVESYLEIIHYYQNIDLKKALDYCITAEKLTQNNNLPQKEILVRIEKVKCLISLNNMDQVSKELFSIEQLTNAVNDENLLGKYYKIKGLAFSYTDDYVNAMDYSLKSIPYFIKTNDSLKLAEAYNLVGVIYDITGNSQKALEYYLQSKEIAQKQNNLKLLGKLSNNIGIIYDILDNNNEALNYYYKSLEYYNKSDFQNGISNAFINISSLLSELERFDEALIYANKAKILNKKLKNKNSNSLIFENIGNIYMSLKMYDSAFFYFQKTLKINSDLGYSTGMAQAYINFGDYYYTLKKFNKAIDFYKKTIEYAEKTHLSELLEYSMLSLSKIYALKGNYKLAYQYQNKMKVISDSIKDNDRKEDIKLSELQIEFKNQAIRHKQKLLEYKDAHSKELKKQLFERRVFFVSIILIFIIAIFLYRSLKKINNTNNKLIKQNREIEDQKQLIEISNIELKEQYTFTETLLNTIPNPVFYTDKNSSLLGCNNAFEEISGKKVDDIIGMKLSDINIKTNISCDVPKLFSNPGKELARNEGSMIFNKGKEHDVICYRKGIVNSDDKLLGSLGIIIDVTEIKKAEKDLKYSQGKLKEAIQAKDKFFSIMAHDLKNPFNAILGLTNIISDDYESHTYDEIKQYIKLINQSATHIYNLLENLLEWARAQSGFIDKVPVLFPINEIIQECINLFHQSIKQKNIRLNFNSELEYLVYADKNMIMTVIRNLLSNAIKYSPVDGSIDILIVKHTDKIDVLITDNGIGISDNNIEKLFKIDKPITTPGVLNEKGTGLGLIICQEFVKINNGSIKVKSKESEGSTFIISLPTFIG